MRTSAEHYDAALTGRRCTCQHHRRQTYRSRRYRFIRAAVRVVVVGGGWFFLLVVLPGWVDVWTR